MYQSSFVAEEKCIHLVGGWGKEEVKETNNAKVTSDGSNYLKSLDVCEFLR